MNQIIPSSFVKKLANSLCIILLAVLAGLISLSILPNRAWAQVPLKGRFTLTQACSATTAIKGGNSIALSIGENFEAVGLNKQNNPTHAWIAIPGTRNRWVALSCGELNPPLSPVADRPINDRPQKPLEPNKKFLPFFDKIDNPVRVKDGSFEDITPSPPVLNNFDLAINKLCGAPGKVVEEEDFKDTLEEFPGVLANIKEGVGGYLVAGRTSDDEFLDDLTEIWFKAKGFDHVFCGEPGKGIGGLHFVGRYLDLQEKLLAGILPGSERNAEVIPDAVYTIGVGMQVGDRFVSSPIKGYAYTLDAEEILELGAKAYKDNPSSVPTTQACLLTITDDGETFTNIFVTKNGAIRTFYSDATPSFDKDPECNVD